MKLNEINGKFTGYYWLSNSDTPVILNNESADFAEYDNSNPFIQEAYFTDDVTSYSIKHFDGKGHIISEVKIADIANETYHDYLADAAIIRAGKDKELDIKLVSFIQEWKDEEDKLCKNMQVLKPAKIAFIGFDKKKENKND